MAKMYALLVAAAAAAACESAAVQPPAVTFKHPGYVKTGWAQTTHTVPDETAVKFTVVVQEQGAAEVRRIASAVSDPSSPSYGKYLTQAQLDGITRPAAADMSAVKQWLSSSPVSFTLRGVSNIDVVGTAAAVSALLSTDFHVAKTAGTPAADTQYLIRAGDYSLPPAVDAATATVFGLHGLPLPRTARKAVAGTSGPASVDPTVIYSTYKVTKQTVRRSPSNRQAVAEFQGQFMNSTDLKGLFAKYVKGYKAGVDDTITKHVGPYQESSGGVEAELDIQYIMGVSPGIQTEFWEFPGQDFGADLNQWTSNLTSQADVPLVHSVSYGWQGNLTQINVKTSDVDVVDANFAKLAAKGISIMISSGDSGSGFASDNGGCDAHQLGEKGVGIEGTGAKESEVEAMDECCESAFQTQAKGWTFVPAQKASEASTQLALGSPADEEADEEDDEDEGPGKKNATIFKFNKAEYHVAEFGTKGLFKSRDVFLLTGHIKPTKGGTVKAKNLNGSFPVTVLNFGPGVPQGNSHGGPKIWHYNVSAKFGVKNVKGVAMVVQFDPSQPAKCFDLQWGNDGIWEQGPNPPPPPPPGHCTTYATVTKKTTANSTTVSGFAAKQTAPQLWASWPASSPWVTAVGATRFVGQTVGNAEMATDQFGSGGGFSKMFTQDNAGYQSAAVAKYLATVDASTLPPKASYNPLGRATPDVSALGEGYQVFVGGQIEPVGGTSASSPAFAGLVSLLNEARLTAGKPALGFLNPFLYTNEDAFTDVTLGSNKINRGGAPVPYGFNCSAGWDPATGLGTPLFDKLLAAAMKV